MRKLVVTVVLTALALAGAALLSATPSPDSQGYDAWKRQQTFTPELVVPPVAASSGYTGGDAKDPCTLLIPLDETTFTLAMSPNDDSYLGPITLPFTFSLYGQPYTQCWINNNGNITFDTGYSSYTPWGFPIDYSPMVAPFFADVDTRGTGSVWYQTGPNYMVVVWDSVGYYSNGIDRLNTFELIISDGTYDAIGLGNNVAFSYVNMDWTTGGASGGYGGLGGTPATVGINKGDGVYYAQIGRFDQAGIAYDGPFDLNDGVDWLDCQLFLFNTGGQASNVAPVFVATPPAAVNLNQGDVWNFSFSIVSPEQNEVTTAVVNHSIPSGVTYVVNPGNTCTVDFSITATPDNGGAHLVTVIATDNGVPPLSSSYEFMIYIEAATVPVELSSFNAVVTANNDVQLGWTTQSEANLMGYRVYRNESSDHSGSALITPTLIPATNTSTTQAYSVTDGEVETGHTYYYWLESVDMSGTEYYGPLSVTLNGDNAPSAPGISSLKNAYPNPFKANGSTSIEVSLKRGENGTLTIYNLAGQVVRTYSIGEGSQTINWNGKDSLGQACGSGIYFYRLRSANLSETKKLVIIK